MPFTVPTYDELLNAILTDYINQFPSADTSKGSLIYIKSAAIASALWGLYQHQRWITNQIFPDTADVEALEHHCWTRGITRKNNETDTALLARLLDYIRRPPAGGNKYDYIKWAESITGVKEAFCVPLAQGLGSVDVVIIADKVLTGSEIPTQALIDQVKAYIDDVRPVTYSAFRVFGPTIITIPVTMAVTGAAVDRAMISSDITDYMNSLTADDDFFPARLTQIAVNNGAETVVITTPNAPVVTAATELVRPGVISVA